MKKKTTPHKKSIAVLIEEGATAGYLLSELKNSFNQTAEISVISSHDIKNNGILSHTDILFIPGVEKASKTYRDNIGLQGGHKIRKWIKKGGVAVGICQGAYLLTEKFEYADKRAGKTRYIKSPCGIFEGTAYGPIPEYTNFEELENPFIDHTVAKLAFNDSANGASCYNHGPYLHIASDAAHHEYEVIARFSEVQNSPIAIAKRNFGKGKAIFCGVVPEVNGLKMAETDYRVLPKSTPFGAYIETGIAFAKELADSEEERKYVWNRLLAEIK